MAPTQGLRFIGEIQAIQKKALEKVMVYLTSVQSMVWIRYSMPWK